MSVKTLPPVTFLSHENQWKLKLLLGKLFNQPDPEEITRVLEEFLRNHLIPIDDFPWMEGTYTRTVLQRDGNGYEAMAARWSKGTISSIHGHPFFNYFFVVHGAIQVDDYVVTEGGLLLTASGVMNSGESFSHVGEIGTYENNIHKVEAIEETLSIHLSSDDSAKGKIFD